MMQTQGSGSGVGWGGGGLGAENEISMDLKTNNRKGNDRRKGNTSAER